MSRLAAVLAMSCLLCGAGGDEKGKLYDPLKIEDIEAIGKVVRKFVAYIEVKAEQKSELITDLNDERDGFGVVLDDKHVAVLAFLVEDAKEIQIHGTKHRTLEAKVVVYHIPTRVAVLETSASLASIGLEAPKMSPEKSRSVDQPVFALMSTTDEGSVLTGVITDTGRETPEFEGLVRSDLELKGGMPVFDARARFVGFSRAVAWDKDPHFLVPPELIAKARTSTRARHKVPSSGSD